MNIRRKLLLTAAWCTLGSWCAAQSSTTLDVSIVSPTGSIGVSDRIHAVAATPSEVFGSSGYSIWSSYSIQGTTINWNISSYPPPPDSIVLWVLLPMVDEIQFGPLAAGEYTLNAHWGHQGWQSPWAPSSGDGSLNFTVGGVDQQQQFDGDYNRDGSVDGADLLVWQGSLGMGDDTGEPGPPGDGDYDGVVDGSDLNVWQSDFAAASGANQSATPEPTTICGLLILAPLVFANRRRHASRSHPGISPALTSRDPCGMEAIRQAR